MRRMIDYSGEKSLTSQWYSWQCGNVKS